MSFNTKRFLTGFSIGLIGVFCLLLCGCNQGIVGALGEIETIILGIIPIASGLASALLPAEAALITAAANEASAGVKAVQAYTKTYLANPNDTTLQKVTAAMTAAQANLTQLMAAAQVKDPATAAKITAIVNAANLSLAAVEASIQAQHPATVAAAATS